MLSRNLNRHTKISIGKELTKMDRRKPPYQQGYEDGRSDYLANEPDRKSIYDYDCYHDEPDSKDRMFYEEGYEDGFMNKEMKWTSKE